MKFKISDSIWKIKNTKNSKIGIRFFGGWLRIKNYEIRNCGSEIAEFNNLLIEKKIILDSKSNNSKNVHLDINNYMLL